MLAYTTALDLPEGVLIYCLDANRPDDPDNHGSTSDLTRRRATEASDSAGTGAVSSVRVRHAGKVLHTYALDLSGTTKDVARNLGELADWIEKRTVAMGRLQTSAVG